MGALEYRSSPLALHRYCLPSEGPAGGGVRGAYAAVIVDDDYGKSNGIDELLERRALLKGEVADAVRTYPVAHFFVGVTRAGNRPDLRPAPRADLSHDSPLIPLLPGMLFTCMKDHEEPLLRQPEAPAVPNAPPHV